MMMVVLAVQQRQTAIGEGRAGGGGGCGKDGPCALMRRFSIVLYGLCFFSPGVP